MGNGKEITVVKWQEGTNLQNFTRKEVFDFIQDVDHSVFHENGLASQESDIARYEAYTDSYIFALCENKIVGYLCYFPITEQFYQKVIEGKQVYDGDIENTDICGLNDNSNYIFLLSVAVRPEFHKKGVSRKFSEILFKEFCKINIKDIVSYAFTPEGERFLSLFGLRNCKDMEDDIKLMKGYVRRES